MSKLSCKTAQRKHSPIHEVTNVPKIVGGCFLIDMTTSKSCDDVTTPVYVISNFLQIAALAYCCFQW